MFQMMGVFAEFERAMIAERVRAGMARARVSGTRSGKPIGRPGMPEHTRQAIRAAYMAGGIGFRGLAEKFGVSQKRCGAGPRARRGRRPRVKQ
jgi:DNA invertase Pin-like site-specific DNA recombinase